MARRLHHPSPIVMISDIDNMSNIVRYKRPYSNMRSIDAVTDDKATQELTGLQFSSTSDKNDELILAGYRDTNSEHARRSYIIDLTLNDTPEDIAAYLSREWFDSLKGDGVVEAAIIGIGSAGQPIAQEGLTAVKRWFGIQESLVAITVKTQNSDTPPLIKNFKIDAFLNSIGKNPQAFIHDASKSNKEVGRPLENCKLHDLELDVNEYLLIEGIGTTPQTNLIGPIGRSGLSNMGNTCFMNSSLQALLHVPELVTYFGSGKYAYDLNRENPIGCQGKIAEAFANLVQDLYSKTGDGVITPWSFRMTVGRFNQTFANRSQQDSQEFTVFLLDSLHEDLNRVHNKPTTEKPELKDAENPEDIRIVTNLANESWKTYKLRNDSLIVDLFTGMYKSTLFCPVCNKVNITFDPFLDLTLPLPQNSVWIKSVTIVPAVASEKVVTTDILLTPNSKAIELREQAAKLLGSVCLDITIPSSFACDVFESKFYRVLNDNGILSAEISETDSIFIYMTPGSGHESKAIPVYLRHSGSETGIPFYIFVTSIEEADIKTKIEERITQLQVAEYVTIETIWAFSGSTDDLNRVYGNSCLRILWTNQEIQETCSEPFEEVFPLELREEKSINVSRDMFGSTVSSPSPITPNSDSDIENLDDSLPISGPSPLLSSRINETKFIDLQDDCVLIVDVNTCCQPSIQSPVHISNEEAEKAKGALRHHKNFSLQETLKNFETPETLGEDDLWYCPQCKDFRRAKKQLDIWQLPDILMIHLKRFSGAQSMAHKVDDLIEFPLEGLDLKPFTSAAEFEGNREKHLYDLFAVDNHFGGMEGGHYTAYVRDPFSDTPIWLHFNDSHVSPIEESLVCSPAAYLLFYRRRGLKSHYTENIKQILCQLRSGEVCDNSVPDDSL